jgi:hypothetical protein
MRWMILKILAVLVLSLPLSICATFALGDVWAWFEHEHGIESVGHAMYAGWCYAVTYGATVFVGVMVLILLSLRKGRPREERRR